MKDYHKIKKKPKSVQENTDFRGVREILLNLSMILVVLMFLQQ